MAAMKVEMNTMEARLLETMQKMIQESKKEESSDAARSPNRTPQARTKRTKFDEEGATGIVSNLAKHMFGLQPNEDPPVSETEAKDSSMEDTMNHV